MSIEPAVLDLSRFTPQQGELIEVTWKMLHAIDHGDTDTYCDLCLDDLTCYEPEICPYRIDGLDFHRTLMAELKRSPESAPLRFDMLTPSVQIHGDTAVVCYTRLRTYGTEGAVRWHTCNETRVFVRQSGQWKMAHFHRSPT